jgi:hypothetical protein
MANMYRITTDFHGGWYGWGGLQQAIFVMGNFTNATLNGANGTWPDLDMIPLGPDWWDDDVTNDIDEEKRDRGETIASLWMITRSPLMHAGSLPTDSTTLSFLTNADALAMHGSGSSVRVAGYTGNVSDKIKLRVIKIYSISHHIPHTQCSCDGGTSSGTCTIFHDPTSLAANVDPCIVRFASNVGDDNNNSSSFTALAVINMGENRTETARTHFTDLGLAADQNYRVVEVWSGESLSVLFSRQL